MKIMRLFADSNGETHAEPLPVTFAGTGLAQQSEMRKASGVTFVQMAPGTTADWHPAPRRQLVINLQGAVEIGMSDGTVNRFGPGEGFLAEDVTGKGHTTKVVSSEPRIMAIIPLAE